MSDFRKRTAARVTPRSARAWVAAMVAILSAGCHVMDYSPRFEEGEIGIFDDLFTVSVIDDQRVVAAGAHGSVYWTENGGDTWQRAETDTDRYLYGVSMGDPKNGWAVGQSGTIIRTTDGGRSWTAQYNLKMDEGSHLFGVHAIDGNRAWVVGEWGTRIYTDDGGETWQDRSIPVTLSHPMFVWLSPDDQEKVRRGEIVYEDVGLNNIYCRPEPSTHCWIVGEFGYIFYSEDQGETWERGEIEGDVRMDPIRFGYDEIAMPEEYVPQIERLAEAIAEESHLNVLIDPFVSQREVETYGSDPEDPTELFDLLSARIDETRSYLEAAGILFDRLRMPNKPPWDFEDFVADDPEFLNRYIEGRIAEEPMVKVAVIQNPFLFTVNFADDQHGLISGLGGVILRSEDGGRSWRYQDTNWKQAFYSVAADHERAIAIGEKGLIRYSPDGGRTWLELKEEHFPTIFTFMRDLGFDSSGKSGFIVGQDGMVLRTTDGGTRWTQVLPPPDRRRVSS